MSLKQFFYKHILREKWRQVATISTSQTYTYEDARGNIYFHLIESEYGNRRIKFGTTLPTLSDSNTEHYGKRDELYQLKLHKWINGRNFHDIPSYDSVPEEETMEHLQGK